MRSLAEVILETEIRTVLWTQSVIIKERRRDKHANFILHGERLVNVNYEAFHRRFQGDI